MCDGGENEMEFQVPTAFKDQLLLFFFFKLLLKNSRHILDLFSEKPFLIRMEAMDATFHLS